MQEMHEFRLNCNLKPIIFICYFFQIWPNKVREWHHFVFKFILLLLLVFLNFFCFIVRYSLMIKIPLLNFEKSEWLIYSLSIACMLPSKQCEPMWYDEQVITCTGNKINKLMACPLRSYFWNLLPFHTCLLKEKVLIARHINIFDWF